MAAKIAKWVALPTAMAGASIVHAASDEEPESRRMKAHQLPIYNAPPLNSRYIDENPGRLQSRISSVRNTTSYYVSGCKDAYLFVKNGIISSVQFGKDAYVYLKNPPPEFLPKVGVITVSGLTGLVLARKGSRFKKICYPLGLCTLGISVCYPAQSVIIAKVIGGKAYAASHKTYEAIGSLWTKKSTTEVLHTQDKDTQQQVLGAVPVSEAQKIALKSEEKVKSSQIQTDSVPLIAEVKPSSVRSDVLKATKFKPDPSLMDHGQSSPEDVDMYSTRS